MFFPTQMCNAVRYAVSVDISSSVTITVYLLLWLNVKKIIFIHLMLEEKGRF